MFKRRIDIQEGYMMKLKTIAATLAIALSATGAQAMVLSNVVELGDLGTTPIYGVRNVLGSFSEIINFNVVDPYNWVGGNIGNLPVGNIFNITNLAVTFYDAANAGGSSWAVFSGDSYYAPTGILTAGDYSMVISGTATGSMGGMYTYAATAQMVPEAETYAMFLAGLGLMGFVARRRRAD
jgi:hypothetical protein